MKGLFIKFADAVSGGYAFRLEISWWEVGLFVLLIAGIVYFLKKRRK
jgi:hypothetical protein